VPLRATRVVLTGWGWTDMAAVGTFTAGLALEVLADGQKAEAKRQGVRGLYKDGVWSVVRHPNYLGDALVHTAFALLALNTPGAHPALFLGPLANYVFLRFVSGDAQVEAAQEERYNQFDPAKERQLHAYRKEKNAFWPAPAEFTNPWTLAIIAAGAAGVGLERVLRAVVKPSLL
jgi:steroid 5-alpha reductase family enzyme